MQVWKTVGRKPKALADVPDCPPELVYVWEWYLDLFTGSRLSYQEIHYWTQIKSLTLKAWEVEALRSVDKLFWEVHNGG